MNYTLADTRAVLGALKAHGLTTQDIARRLELYQIKTNARGLRHMYAGRTKCPQVLHRALVHLLTEVNDSR